jgi:hypothetical protein
MSVTENLAVSIRNVAVLPILTGRLAAIASYRGPYRCLARRIWNKPDTTVGKNHVEPFGAASARAFEFAAPSKDTTER